MTDLPYSYSEGTLYEEDRVPPPLIRGSLKKKIRNIVVILHVCIFLLPLLSTLLSAWWKPKKLTVAKVVFVDSMPNDNLIPSHHPGKNPTPNDNPALGDGNPPPPMPDVPDDPGRLEKLPDMPKPQPPRKKPDVKKMVQKVPVKDPVKQPVKQTAKKPQPKYLDAKDIKITRNTQTQRSQPRRASSSSIHSASKSLEDLAKDIRRGTGGSQKGSVSGKGDPGGAGGPLGEYNPFLSDYYAKLITFLRQRWTNPPSKNSLRGLKPVVRLHFEIDSSGRIRSLRIEKSGNAVMDASVQEVVRDLRALPPPPKGMPLHFYVNMRIDD